MTSPGTLSQDAPREEQIARAALAAVRGEAAPIGDEVKQLIADAAVGRAIREAATTLLPNKPRLHISWDDGKGGCDGMFIDPVPFYIERRALAESAQELLDALAERPAEVAACRPLTPAFLDAMRSWIAQDRGHASGMTDEEIEIYIAALYDGGVEAFIRDHEGRGGDA